MRMNKFFTLAVSACVLTVSLADSAISQTDDERGPAPERERGGGRRGRGEFGGPGGGFRGGFGGPGGPMQQISRATILAAAPVREELGIKDDQAASIDAALEAYREERRSSRPDRAAFENMSDDERKEFFDKMRKDGEALNQKTDTILNALLEPAQLERLDQIAIQIRLNSQTIAALKSEDLKGKLVISDEQLGKLDEIEASVPDRFADARDAAADADRGAMREIAQKLREEVRAEALAVLTDDQKTTLDTLKGATFEFDMASLMAGRDGEGRGGRGAGRRPRNDRDSDGPGGERRGSGERDTEKRPNP